MEEGRRKEGEGVGERMVQLLPMMMTPCFGVVISIAFLPFFLLLFLFTLPFVVVLLMAKAETLRVVRF